MSTQTIPAAAVSADGWDNPGGFLSAAVGPATTAGSSTPDVVVTFAAAALPTGATLTKLAITITAGAVPSDGAQPAIDQIRPTVAGEPVGDPQQHGNGLGETPAEYTAELYPADLVAAGITPAVLNAGGLGAVLSFYDRTGAENGNAAWSAGPVVAVAEYMV